MSSSTSCTGSGSTTSRRSWRADRDSPASWIFLKVAKHGPFENVYLVEFHYEP
jgi:hypothetical protein